MTSDLTPKQTYDASPMFGADPVFSGAPKNVSSRDDEFGNNPNDPGAVIPVGDTFLPLLAMLLLYGAARLYRSRGGVRTKA